MREWICVQDMGAAAATIVHLVQVWAEEEPETAKAPSRRPRTSAARADLAPSILSKVVLEVLGLLLDVAQRALRLALGLARPRRR